MGRRAPGEGGLKVRVLSIGKDRSGLFAPAVDEYASRLQHYTRLSLVELPAGRNKDAEAEIILGKATPADWLVALDERGDLLSTQEWAALIGKAQHQAKDLLFVIGGDEGLAQSVRQAAKSVIALGRITLPHRLARVVVVEQLYRAFTVLRGEPYHK